MSSTLSVDTNQYISLILLPLSVSAWLIMQHDLAVSYARFAEFVIARLFVYISHCLLYSVCVGKLAD